MDKKMKVVPLKIQPNQDAIKMLENTIERIRSGEITAVGMAYTTSEGSIGGDVSTGNDNFLMWASMEHLSRTFYTQTVLGEET
jgi:hypothetical protein